MIFLKNSDYSSSLSVCSNTSVLYSVTFINSLISAMRAFFSSFQFWLIWGDFLQRQSINRNGLLPSFLICITVISYTCLIALARISYGVLIGVMAEEIVLLCFKASGKSIAINL